MLREIEMYLKSAVIKLFFALLAFLSMPAAYATSVEEYVEKAKETLSHFDYEQGYKILDKALELNPQSHEANCVKAHALVNEKDYYNGLVYADKAVKLNPICMSARISRADCLVESGEHKRAMKDIGTLIIQIPTGGGFYYLAARCFLAENRLQEALAYCNKALINRPVDRYFALRADIRARIGGLENLHESRKDHQKANALGTHGSLMCAEYYNCRLWSIPEESDYGPSSWSRLLRGSSYPGSITGCRDEITSFIKNVGKQYEKQNKKVILPRPRPLKQKENNSSQIPDGLLTSLENRTKYLIERGREQEALRLIGAAIGKYPHSHKLFCLMGQNFISNNPLEALGMIERAYKLEPNCLKNLDNRAELLNRFQLPDITAQAYLEVVNAKCGHSPKFDFSRYVKIAQIYLEEGKYDECLKFCKLADESYDGITLDTYLIRESLPEEFKSDTDTDKTADMPAPERGIPVNLEHCSDYKPIALDATARKK